MKTAIRTIIVLLIILPLIACGGGGGGGSTSNGSGSTPLPNPTPTPTTPVVSGAGSYVVPIPNSSGASLMLAESNFSVNSGTISSYALSLVGGDSSTLVEVGFNSVATTQKTKSLKNLYNIITNNNRTMSFHIANKMSV